MKKIFPILLMIFAACGPQLDTSEETYCYADGINVTLAYKTDCDTIAWNIGLAKKMIIDNGILIDSEFDHMIGGIELRVEADTDLGCVDKTGPFCTMWRWGLYTPFTNGGGKIQLACHMKSTLHELFHRIEHSANVWNARGLKQGGDSHAWWDENGYNRLDEQFQENSLDGCH